MTAPNGAAVDNASVAMVFRIYDAPTIGSALHTEAQSVVVSNGIFNVVLGSSTALALPFDNPYYLGITIGSDIEMTPRQSLAASPYALRSASVSSSAPWVVVSAASQLAEPNKAYLVTNPAVTNITLPTNAAGGDSVRVAARASANGFSISPGVGQQFET